MMPGTKAEVRVGQVWRNKKTRKTVRVTRIYRPEHYADPALCRVLWETVEGKGPRSGQRGLIYWHEVFEPHDTAHSSEDPISPSERSDAARVRIVYDKKLGSKTPSRIRLLGDDTTGERGIR